MLLWLVRAHPFGRRQSCFLKKWQYHSSIGDLNTAESLFGRIFMSMGSSINLKHHERKHLFHISSFSSCVLFLTLDMTWPHLTAQVLRFLDSISLNAVLESFNFSATKAWSNALAFLRGSGTWSLEADPVSFLAVRCFISFYFKQTSSNKSINVTRVISPTYLQPFSILQPQVT